MDARHGPLLKPTTISSVLHMKWCCFESSEPGASRRTTASSPRKTPSNELGCERFEATVPARSLLWAGGAASHERPQATHQEVRVGITAGKRGATWAGGGKRKNERTAWQRIVECLVL